VHGPANAPGPGRIVGPTTPATGWRALDHRIALALHRRATPRLSWWMRRATDAASGQVAVPIALTLVSLELRDNRPKAARAIAVTWIGGLLLHVGIKLIYRRKRPTLFPALTRAGGYSLPSGHTVTAVVTYGLAASAVNDVIPRRWHWLPISIATAICSAVATSRVYLGVHFPTDVMAGALLGLTWLRGSLKTLARIEAEYFLRTSRRRRRVERRRVNLQQFE
jgi:membrane-associated phospholipid phosphatase